MTQLVLVLTYLKPVLPRSVVCKGILAIRICFQHLLHGVQNMISMGGQASSSTLLYPPIGRYSKRMKNVSNPKTISYDRISSITVAQQ